MTDTKKPRGFVSISEVARHIEPLAKWQKQFKPAVATIRIRRTDYDLINRWVRASLAVGFEFSRDQIFYWGYMLIPDGSQSRYKPRSAAIGQLPIPMHG